MPQPEIPQNYAELRRKYKGLCGTLKQEQDQFGYELFTETHIFYDSDEIRKYSRELPKDFPAEIAAEYAGCQKQSEYDLGYITDFSSILVFGIDGSDCPFCMDFSENEATPRVIYWDAGQLIWRVIADSLENFFNLFDWG
ncbi:SMI1/KNR4 family protein [Eikenella sp. S3360]|uniref:SMI1/KNR4 family protein n=1 Tax=Eikenella glucosivorans TaxID=2766967 RepID=A0ABS0N8B3_9NEIS|nr:SMI1/KNR4 family protein [Eikenella glucosivorans]MBH5328551.1 SMI1/KNR4 family protein [Eikenella glucosivorans]